MAPFHPQMELATFGVAASGGGGGGLPALPTLTSTGQTQIFRLYSDAPTGHLYQDDALSIQANSGDPVAGIKDISGAGNNFADTVAGRTATLTAAALNSKRALSFSSAAGSLIESDNSTNINLLRTATNIAMLAVIQITSYAGVNPVLAMASIKSKSDLSDCWCLRVSGSGTALLGGRFGSDAGGSSPLLLPASAINSGWGGFGGATLKIVLRSATGIGAVQKLNVAGSAAGTGGSASTTYTNGSGDVDGASTAWDYCTLGGQYNSGSAHPAITGYLAEVVMWMGTSQLNDTDTGALMSYASGTAGF